VGGGEGGGREWGGRKKGGENDPGVLSKCEKKKKKLESTRQKRKNGPFKKKAGRERVLTVDQKMSTVGKQGEKTTCSEYKNRDVAGMRREAEGGGPKNTSRKNEKPVLGKGCEREQKPGAQREKV